MAEIVEPEIGDELDLYMCGFNCLKVPRYTFFAPTRHVFFVTCVLFAGGFGLIEAEFNDSKFFQVSLRR